MRLMIAAAAMLAGCVTPGAPVVTTQVLDKPTPVHCKVDMPRECRDTYAVDALQDSADPVQVNRAVLAELEQRRACEVKLRAAVAGCGEGGR